MTARVQNTRAFLFLPSIGSRVRKKAANRSLPVAARKCVRRISSEMCASNQFGNVCVESVRKCVR
jgi:hypothetical protein